MCIFCNFTASNLLNIILWLLFKIFGSKVAKSALVEQFFTRHMVKHVHVSWHLKLQIPEQRHK